MVGIGILVCLSGFVYFQIFGALSFKEGIFFAESTTDCFWWFIVAIQPILLKTSKRNVTLIF